MTGPRHTRRRMMQGGTAALSLAVLATARPARAQGGPQTPAELVRQFGAALEARDAERIAGFYAEQGVILNPRGHATVGRDEIRTSLARNFAAGQPRLRLVTARFDGDAETGVILWTWEAEIPVQGQPPQRRRIRSMLYVKKTPEGWRIFADMFQDYPVQPG
jgi:uncharacterized protein (TIGR02246 family)